MTDTSGPGPITIEEIADRVIPTEPKISPDGRHIAFAAATSARKKKRHDRAIWVSTDGNPARRFTGGYANNHDPRWSPDSGTLLFLAQRDDDDDHRLYVIPVDGGEAQELGELKGSLSEPAWSPDGSKIAVLRPDPDTDEVKKRKDDKDDPVVYEVDDKVDRLWIVDANTGKARCISHGKRHIWSFAWSPDGDDIVAITGDLPTANESFRASALRILPVSDGASRHLADFHGLPGSPVEGERIVAYVGDDHRDDPSPAIWTIPFNGGTPRKLIDNNRAATMALIADPASGDGLVATQIEGARQRQYRLVVDSSKLSLLPMTDLNERGSILSSPSVASTGDLAVVWSTIDTPEEVYRVSKNGDVTRLTSFGESFTGRLCGGEIVTWSSSDGVDIEGVLVYPRDYVEGERYPLVVQVHGGPAWMWLDRLNMSWHDWAQMLAAKGFAVLLPNPRGSIGNGSAFEQLLQDDVGGGESHDLISGALAIVERGIADRDRLGITGWSWGGYLTAWTITQTDIFRAAVMGAGVANLVSDHGAGDIAKYNTLLYLDHPYRVWEPYADRSPVRFAGNVTTPTLIVHGESDVRVSVTQGQEYYRALQVCGVPVTFVRYPREGHSFQEYHHHIDVMRRIEDWLTKHIG